MISTGLDTGLMSRNCILQDWGGIDAVPSADARSARVVAADLHREIQADRLYLKGFAS